MAEAETIYRHILKAQPNHFDSLHLLGVIYHQRGNYAEAIRQIDVALKLNPELASAYNNRGHALKALRRLDEALASYDKAIVLKPDHAEAFNNRGVALKELRRFEEALASYDKALALRPDHAEAFYNRGVVLQELKRLDEAVASYDKAIALKPDHANAFNNRGVALKELRRLDEALASYEKALALKADYAEAFSNHGNALKELKRLDEALTSYDKAIALKPDYAEAFYNRGNALQELTRLDEALASFDRALALKPDYADAFNNRGVALSILGRAAEAEASYREALRLRPDFADAHNNLAYALLLTGRFEEGWTEHEWRWKTKHMSGGLRDFSAPLWNGETIGDRVILLHAEQGLGDTLQFCRYVPLIASGARIVLEVQAPLVRLLSQLPGVMEIVARGDSLPSFDLHCPLLSLPRAVGTTLDTIPASTPYLAADPARAADWRKRLAGLDGLRVGLVWAGGRRLGSPNLVAVDRRRSIALDTMAPLGDSIGGQLHLIAKRWTGGSGRQSAAWHGAARFYRRSARLRGHGGARRRPRSGDQRRYGGRPSGRRARQAGLAPEPLRYLLALAAEPRRQPLVSDAAPVSPAQPRRLEQCDLRRCETPCSVWPPAIAINCDPAKPGCTSTG